MSKNGLNYVTKEEEKKLIEKEQKPEIISIFKIFYILFNQSYDDIEEQKIIPNLLSNLMINVWKEDGLSKKTKFILFNNRILIA